jgi:hypothetical protein
MVWALRVLALFFKVVCFLTILPGAITWLAITKVGDGGTPFECRIKP